MSDALRTCLRGIGQLFITAGVVLLLFCVYELKVTNLYTDQQQHTLEKKLDQAWAAAPRPRLPGAPQLVAYQPGAGIARIYLPTLGRKEVHVIVEGVTHEDLKKGPGHYPRTADPGAIGNFVVSGHRTTYGAPFNRVDELHVGDPIVVETVDSFLTYVVTGERVVSPSHVGVILPVPDAPGQQPTEALMTLTTCNPKYSASQRLVVEAKLGTRLAKGPGVVPPALRSVLGKG